MILFQMLEVNEAVQDQLDRISSRNNLRPSINQLVDHGLRRSLFMVIPAILVGQAEYPIASFVAPQAGLALYAHCVASMGSEPEPLI